MLNSKQCTEIAGMLRAYHAHNTDILAEDAQRQADAASGYATPASLSAAIVLDNDRAMSEEIRRRVLMASARAEDPETADVDAADALRDWLRFEVIDRVTDRRQYGLGRELELGYRAANERTGLSMGAINARQKETARGMAEGMVMFVNAMAAHAVDQIDFLEMARGVLTQHGSDETLYDHVKVLRALIEAEKTTDEPSGEANAFDVAACIPGESNETVQYVTSILHDLDRMNIVGARYVSGTSGHLFSVSRELSDPLTQNRHAV